MNCQETKLLLSEYLDRELSYEVRKAVRRHLAGCFDCADECRKLQKSIRLLKKYETLRVPRNYSRTLLYRKKKTGKHGENGAE